MARKTFFSFHYEKDVWRVNIVRNSWVTADTAGFIDAAAFEEIKKGGEDNIKKWIDGQMTGTSVTVVLIGAETSNREYVKYEVQKSYSRGNGLLGIYIHQLKDNSGNTASKGDNMFGEIGKDASGNPVYFSANYPCYDWINDKGYDNLGAWIEAAAKKAGK